ncbi:adenylyltransferase/cytidyltransferase family protein [Paenibacillus spiritus]|uniref:Adenylyltransferase/cytidyltransferase family protein n=1 Tax=Paenibacillus spiritus TaxID=2496557 RepID=A0A5J5FVS0_9BACL|nr:MULTISPECIES: adenylyltransferase/cytidyltransferase family protein [Paenibacillus]KAA8997967.1 adenylyltransferase/cytidyltransferase family protein [Paenibacillus spiritus]
MKPYKTGYVPGVFDLFHVGHLNLLHQCKELSEYLIAGVLTDELVLHFKGRAPYIPFEERLAIVESIKYVDRAVAVSYHNTVKWDAWQLYRYDCHFSGDDHKDDWQEEHAQLREVGSDMIFFPYTQGTSSTQIKKLIDQSLI